MKSSHKIKEWRERSPETLRLSRRELREKLRSLRFLLASGKLKNTQEVKELKKDIARVSTILNSKKEKHV
ncbi:MAG: 50S ribosomal protein L29 [bacterium]|nr:50S ribosomal protein L29 [bacterium]